MGEWSLLPVLWKHGYLLSQVQGVLLSLQGRGLSQTVFLQNSYVMQSSKLPVRMWLYTMYKVSVARKGISSLQRAKTAGRVLPYRELIAE